MESSPLSVGGDEEGGSGKKRKRHEDEPVDDISPESRPPEPKKKIGRPKRRPVPLPPETPVAIAPRPRGQAEQRQPESLTRQESQRQGHLLEEQELGHSNLDRPDQYLAVDTAAHMVPFVDDIQYSALQPGNLPPASNLHCNQNRGLRPLPQLVATVAIQMDILIHIAEQYIPMSIDNVVMNPDFTENYVNARKLDLASMGLLVVDLEAAEVRTNITPRGRLRCSQAVAFRYEIPHLGIPHALTRALILPDEHTDGIGINVILGRATILEIDRGRTPHALSQPLYVNPAPCSILGEPESDDQRALL